MTSGYSKPSPEDQEPDDGYQNDGDGELDYNDDTSSDLDRSQKQSNSVDLSRPRAYFKLDDYTKTVKIGENVTLECQVGNIFPQTIFFWFKTDIHHLIYQQTSRVTTDDRFILLPDHSLVILNVKEQDQGSYFCNVLPENITMTAKLVVLSPLQAHIYEGGREITDRSITYNQHNRIEVECKASGSKTNKIDFKWSADGNRLTSNDRIKINGGKLIIEKASYDDIRVYQCLADDGDNGVAHGTVTINIQYTPRVKVSKSIVNTKEGDNAELHCEFETSTESRVIWFKGDEQLPIAPDTRSKYYVTYASPKGNKNSSILVINKVKKTDLGQYTCKVENLIGSQNVNITLTFVPEPPTLQRIERDGDYTVTHWHIRSLQPLTEVMLKYRRKDDKIWTEDVPIDKEQSKEHSGSWKIRHRIALASGHWHAHVKAKNSEGWSTFSNVEDLIVDAKTSGSSTLMTFPMSCVISIATIYSINFSARLFG